VDDGGTLAGGDPPRMGGDWNVNGLILRASHSPINPSSCSGPPGGRSLPCAAFSTHAPDRPEAGPCLAPHSPHILADRPEVGPCLAPHSPHMLRTARRPVPALRRILHTCSGPPGGSVPACRAGTDGDFPEILPDIQLRKAARVSPHRWRR
jgi:hypothetical protein